jgi:hypothetical protein
LYSLFHMNTINFFKLDMNKILECAAVHKRLIEGLPPIPQGIPPKAPTPIYNNYPPQTLTYQSFPATSPNSYCHHHHCHGSKKKSFWDWCCFSHD